MNAYDAAETAFKNGYKQGYEDGKRDSVVHGSWVKHNFLGHDQFVCSECQTLGSPQWKRCPVCEAKMDLPKITPATDEALQKMGENVHGGNNG